MLEATTQPVTLETAMDVPRFRPEQFLDFANLAEAFFFNTNRNGDLIAYDQAVANADADSGPRRYIATLHAESKNRVLKIANQLLRWGIQPGDKVAILSLNRPEWTEAEMAIYAVGGVAVALYVRLSQERLEQLLKDAEARFAVVENEQQLERLAAFTRNCESNEPSHGMSPLQGVLTLEEVPSARPRTFPTRTLAEVLQEPLEYHESQLPYHGVRRDDLATIYYTSGSSGTSTGVPVTHGQTLDNLYQIAVAGLVDYERYEKPDAPQPFVTLILPERAHAFPARNAQLTATSPARARYPAVLDQKQSHVNAGYRESLRRDLREGAAGIVPIVPKVLVAIEQAIRERLVVGRGIERMAKWIIEDAARRIQSCAGGDERLLMRCRRQLLDPVRRRVAARVREQIVGKEFEFFISGGAKLPIETAAFLWAIGLPVYEGYGSTESNCPVATNTPRHCRLGSVGKLFPGIEAKFDTATSELWLRGSNVVRHYWKQEGSQTGVWTSDGWYRTRDVGRLDGDGFLYIADRVDNILIAWNGENVSAAAIEERFVAVPYVDTAIVIGHQRPALIALVTLNEPAIQRWAERTGRVLKKNLANDPDVLALLREHVQLHVNSRAGHVCETVRQLAIIQSLATDDHTLTATEKVRRREIENRYAETIEELYRVRDRWLPTGEPHSECPPFADGTFSRGATSTPTSLTTT